MARVEDCLTIFYGGRPEERSLNCAGAFSVREIFRYFRYMCRCAEEVSPE
jgi:hypothetical protein